MLYYILYSPIIDYHNQLFVVYLYFIKYLIIN